jgi:hypothetical protein
MSNERVQHLNSLQRRIGELARRGEYAEAIRLAGTRCALMKEFVGDRDPFYAAVLDEKAQLHFNAAEYPAAEQLLRAS